MKHLSGRHIGFCKGETDKEQESDEGEGPGQILQRSPLPFARTLRRLPATQASVCSVCVYLSVSMSVFVCRYVCYVYVVMPMFIIMCVCMCVSVFSYLFH